MPASGKPTFPHLLQAPSNDFADCVASFLPCDIFAFQATNGHPVCLECGRAGKVQSPEVYCGLVHPPLHWDTIALEAHWHHAICWLTPHIAHFSQFPALVRALFRHSLFLCPCLMQTTRKPFMGQMEGQPHWLDGFGFRSPHGYFCPIKITPPIVFP